MNVAAWWTAAVLATARVVYPRLLEWRHSRWFPRGPDGVVAGAESIDLPRAGSPAVLVLHGGGDTPQSVRSLAEYLHARGFAVRAPLLENHGRSLELFADCSAELWRTQARAEYEKLRAEHDWVAVVGQSVGGALALDLAAAHPEMKALVLLAPWVAVKDLILLVARTSRIWEVLFPYLPSLGGHSIQDPAEQARALTHGIVTPAELRALAAIAHVAHEALPHVKAPTLTIQSREDGRISREDAERAFDRLGAKDKKFEWTSGAGHVISVDYGKERVFALVGEWLDAHLPP